MVLDQSDNSDDTPLGPFGHIGVTYGCREEIDEKVALAGRKGVLQRDAQQSEIPVSYWAIFGDPDGNTHELSFGQ